LNALLIYLGLGYPRIDAYNVFTKVFETSDNEANIERMKLIDEFIRNFEKQYLDMTYDKNSLYNNYI
jgi:transcriptional antiterminator